MSGISSFAWGAVQVARLSGGVEKDQDRFAIKLNFRNDSQGVRASCIFHDQISLTRSQVHQG
jgi:hypothetical protein